MSEQASYFRLGLFVLITVGLLVGGVILFGAGAWLKEGIMVETYLDESVGGLTVGAPVEYRGVQIGEVTHVGFINQKYEMKGPDQEIRFGRYILVEVEIDPERLPKKSMKDRREILRKRIAAGLRFRLESSLTGPTILTSDYFDPEIHKPLEIDWEPEYLYVPSAPGTMTQVVSAVERLANQIEKAEIDKLLTNLNTLVVNVDKGIAELQVPKLREQVLGLVQELRQSNTSVKRILNNPAIDKGISDLAAAIASAKNVLVGGEDKLTAVVADLPAISARLKTSMQRVDEILQGPELKKIITDLAGVTGDVGPAVLQLRKVTRRLDNLMASQQQDIEAILRGLRTITDNAAALSEDAKDNPSRVLFGDPPPRRQPGEK